MANPLIARRLALLVALGALCGVAQAEPPDALSSASPPAEGGGRVVARERVDGAALRARNLARLSKDRSPVVLLRGPDPLTLGQRLCEAVVPRRPPETPVLVKPNLGGHDRVKTPKQPGDDDGLRGRITQPEFVRGVVRCLKARGHKRITIADGWDSPHAAWQRLIRASGYAEMAAEEGVPLVALDDDGVFDVEGDQPARPTWVSGMERTRVPTLLMPRLVAEHLQRGLFVSVPKLKAHRFAVLSAGVKGTQGLVMLADHAPAHRQKWRLHKEIAAYLRARKEGKPEGPAERAAYVAALEAFAERLSDVLLVEAPDAVLVDAAPAMGGDGFQKLWPVTEGLALGGTNPVLVDRVGAELLGLWDSAALAKELGGHRTSPLLTVAARRLHLDLRAPAVSGDGAAALTQPRPVHYQAMAPFSIHQAAPEAAAPGPAAPPSPAPVAEPAPAPADVPVAHAAHHAGALQIDGRGDEPAWQAATPLRWQTDFSGRSTGTWTQARLLWSAGALYALFELEGAGLRVDTSFPVAEERKDLYVEDCVEMMVIPQAAEPWHFFEMQLGPLGHYFDLEINRRGKPRERSAWQSGLRVATTRDAAARRVVIEAAFTAPEITRLLQPGARLSFGLFRMEGPPPRQYLAWRPARTPRPNFHVPEAFGALILDP